MAWSSLSVKSLLSSLRITSNAQTTTTTPTPATTKASVPVVSNDHKSASSGAVGSSTDKLLTMEDLRFDRGNVGKVASLHLHPVKSNDPMQLVNSMQLIAGKGILNNPRYYDTTNKSSGRPNKNHVSLIEREQIADHAYSLGLEDISPGLVRSNIETTCIHLLNLVDCSVKIGDTAVVKFYKKRVPCKQMDDVEPGLFKLMKQKQGVIAEIIVSGQIKVGDTICILE